MFRPCCNRRPPIRTSAVYMRLQVAATCLQLVRCVGVGVHVCVCVCVCLHVRYALLTNFCVTCNLICNYYKNQFVSCYSGAVT